MKLSRKVWLILGAVILVAALVGAYMVYSRQAGERNDLNARLERAQTLLPGLTTNKNDLENQLAQAESLLNTDKAQFPESVESIEYGEDLFAIATNCNVGITGLTASTPTNKKVGTITYSVSSFVIGVSGGVNDILKFIDAVRTGDGFQLPWSAAVTGVNINVAASAATINVDIYGYKG